MIINLGKLHHGGIITPWLHKNTRDYMETLHYFERFGNFTFTKSITNTMNTRIGAHFVLELLFNTYNDF